MATRSAASATSSAAVSTVVFGDLVNVPVDLPAGARWPGPVNPALYADTGPDFPISGPPNGPWILSDVPPGEFTSTPDPGGVQDVSWMTGHDAPEADWDSSAGRPFAPSAALNPDLHGQDTGAVFQAQHVVPAAVGLIERQTGTGQTYNREYVYEPVNGMWVPAPNNRVDFDQRQTWDPDPFTGGGWAPWDPGYAERPILNNVAYTATPVNNNGSMYGVAGEIPDRSQFNAYNAATYAAPPDPIIDQPAAPAASDDGGWLLV